MKERNVSVESLRKGKLVEEKILKLQIAQHLTWIEFASPSPNEATTSLKDTKATSSVLLDFVEEPCESPLLPKSEHAYSTMVYFDAGTM